jgi:GTP-binding protein EngB required for normal cell division
MRFLREQVIFIGRSNVGKSSLVNFLLNRKVSKHCVHLEAFWAPSPVSTLRVNEFRGSTNENALCLHPH